MKTTFYEKFQHKTRVVIAGNLHKKEATTLFLHVIHFFGNTMDFITSSSENIQGTDFVLFEAENNELLNYHPNIVLITENNDSELSENFLKTIIGGGILIYNEEDESLIQTIENSENFFRKIPYKTPDFQKTNGTNYLNTDIGEIPVQISDENLSFIEGVKHLCQHIGIMEEDFYEALMEFEA